MVYHALPTEAESREEKIIIKSEVSRIQCTCIRVRAHV